MNPAYSDPQLLEWTINLSLQFNLSTFIETGTYHGQTAKIMSDYFEKVITIENNVDNYQHAVAILQDIKNCNLYLGNSPDILKKCLEKNDNSIFFFLDAHWENYWPLLDELKIIKEKKIKPVIAIHDFYVPDEHGNAKFGYDSYQNVPLDYNYIKSSMEEIYENKFDIMYNTSSTINSGVIFTYPKK